MASNQEDNFDLYDDPYVATGSNGGVDPYAEDDDDYYHSSHGGDRGRSGYDDKDADRARGPSSRDGHESVSVKAEERDLYGSESEQNQHPSSREAQGSSDGVGQYDPAEAYRQRDSTSYPQQHQPYERSQYSGPPHQGSNYNSDGGSYEQQQPRQQQQAQGQTSTSSGREQGKMFIGGLNWETTDETLKAYFSRYGELTDCMVMKDPMTNKSRGFGFLTFLDPKHVDAVLKEDHHLDGKMIDPKRAIPREEQEKTEKIFVGGIAPDVTEEEFANYFSQFGHVLDATLMLDRATGRPRGFGFITFESDRGVEAALSRRDLVLHDKTIEVKRAQPKHRADTRNGGGAGGGAGSAGYNGGGYGGGGNYGGYGVGQGGYGGNMGGGRNYGMDPMGNIMGAGGFGGGFGNNAGGADPYQAMGAYAAAAARFGANPAAAAAAAALAQRYRMAAAAAAAAYGAGGGTGAGSAGPGMGGSAGAGGYDPTVALSAFYRQQFGYGNTGAGAGAGNGGGYGSNNGGGYNDQEPSSGSQSSQKRHGSQSGPDGDSVSGYRNNSSSSSSNATHSGVGGSSYGANSGYDSRGSGSSGYNAGRNNSSGSGSGRQGGSSGGSSGPVRGNNSSSSGAGSSSSGGHGRGGGSYHPYQR